MAEICPYSKQQIGWSDSNGNHIPDILDVKPMVAIYPNQDRNSLVFRGKATSLALPNKNPYSTGGTIKPPHDLSAVLHLEAMLEKRLRIKDSFKRFQLLTYAFHRRDITTNKIISVEYRTLQCEKAITDWIKTKPEDGGFEQAVENFAFTLKPLTPGS